MPARILAIRKKQSQQDLLWLGYVVVEKMENNPTFPDPPDTLTALKEILPEYHTALANALSRDKEMVAIKNDKKEILVNLLRELANYVMATCKGDRTLLLGSGFNVSGNVRRKYIPSIEKLEVKIGPPGEAITRARNSTDCVSYAHQYTTEPPGPNTEWVTEGSSHCHYKFEGLISGKRYWFRVVGIGRRRRIGYSPIVTRVIQ
jgi:hypothetical protein